jgi:hypothetical protein
MPVSVFINEGGRLQDRTELAGMQYSNGWWNRIEAADLDLDGDIDFVLGNHGLNSRFKVSTDRPVCMYINDFDENGTVEQIICTFNGDKSYPMALRHDLVNQIPSLKKKYLKYENYRNQTITDIFTPEQLQGAVKLDAYVLTNSVLINDGQGKFSLKALPVEAQLSPVYGIEVADYNGDGYPDLLLGGNLYNVKPEVGRYDASYGVLLKGDGKGGYTSVPYRNTGFQLDGEVRDIVTVATPSGDILLVSRSNDTMLTFLKK